MVFLHVTLHDFISPDVRCGLGLTEDFKDPRSVHEKSPSLNKYRMYIFFSESGSNRCPL